MSIYDELNRMNKNIEEIDTSLDKCQSPTSYQVGGSHYECMKIQPIEFIMANKLSFPVGNIVKYVCRFKHKNGAEDLLKARHYIDILLEEVRMSEE